MARRADDLRIVVVGSIIFDLVMKAERLPREGESLLATNLKFFPGGKGANQAVAVARQGIQTTLIGAVGQDMMGDFLVGALESSGVKTSQVKRDASRTTGCALVTLYPNGNNSILVDPGANNTLRPADVESVRDLVEAADALMAVLEIPLETVQAALALAHRAGKLTVLDAGPPRHCPPEVLKLADIVSPNETELEALSGDKISGRVSAREAAEKLLELGAKAVVLKLGSDGAMLVTGKGTRNARHFPAHKVRAIDPTAAGDAFTAVLTTKLVLGSSLEESIRYANAAGALTVTRLGAQPSLPTRDEVEELAAAGRKTP